MLSLPDLNYCLGSVARERENRGQVGQADAEGRDKGLAQTPAVPRPAGLLLSKAQGGGIC